MAQNDSGKPQEINYIKEAAKLQYNWIALAGLTGFAILSGSALPLLLGAGLELMYLSVVPNNSRFQRLVRSWKFEDEKRQANLRLAALFREIPPEMRQRYSDLDQVCRRIRENYSRLSSMSQIFARQTEDKLQGLQQAYLRLLHSAWQHREYLKTTDLRGVERELAQLESTQASGTARLQEINTRRIDILKKRVDKFHKIRENCEVIDAQCAAVEDVLGLIRDQSVTMRDPQQVSEHLEGLVRDVEQTEETVHQVEDIFGNIPEMNAAADEIPSLSTENIGEPGKETPTRSRVQN